MQSVPPLLPTVVILGAVRYNSNIQSTSFNTAFHLANKTKVIYVENPLTAKDLLKQFFKGPKFINLFKKRSKIRVLNDHLSVVSPPFTWSINFIREGALYRRLLAVNERILVSFIKKILSKTEDGSFIFINSFNFHYPGVGRKLKPALNIYQCVDPIIVPFDKRHGVVSEKQLIKECDLIFCTSKALFEEKSKENRHVYFIPNAADINHFTKVMDQATVVSPAIRKENRPVIGYIGTIERRLDYPLLKELFSLNSDKDFVFAGPLDKNHVPAWFYLMSNLQLLGPISYEELPPLIKAFDVCLIPFKSDAVSRTIFPLKLFEFMGSGKPVVCTNFNPDLKDYTQECIFFGSTATDISRGIELALAEPEKHKVFQVAIAEKNTWEARVEMMMDIMSKHLALKIHVS